MNPDATLARESTLTWIGLGCLLFAAAYGQAPLYYSNQNQYFLHGLAEAGVGDLSHDWLANTLDPTPAFTALVAVTAGELEPWTFYIYHGILLAVYAAGIVGLYAYLAGRKSAVKRWPWFLALFVLVHSAAIRWASYRLFGQDYPWYLQAGVAGQYLLGAMLQPSVFGVLLIVSLALFVHDRPLLAGGSAALAATCHSTYLLPAGLLVAGYLAALLLEGRRREALVTGAFALVLVAPITVYVLMNFGPTSAETFAEAQDILVNLRIPHHARPDLWLDLVALLQIGWIVFATFLTWRTRLFPVLFVVLLLAGLLTAAQVATGDNTLALLFPWRVSAVLMPVATAVILARVVGMFPAGEGGLARAVPPLVLVLLAAAGVGISLGGLAFRGGAEEAGVLDFVRDNHQPGEVYFVPVRVPNLAATTRGSLSSDFKPPAEKRQDARIIPLDFQTFRLATGAAIYVDFKAIPYKDVEVIEWRDRLRFAEAVQKKLQSGDAAEAVAELRDRGVTHLVWPADQPLNLPGVESVYADDAYRVYRLSPAESPAPAKS
jgi:hypothetical protein